MIEMLEYIEENRKFEHIETKRKFTLCWDCKNATGNCSWSENLKPVNGWKAERTHIHSTDIDSYMVYECPKFVRDAIYGGQRKYKES